jgi:hypothetical protein
MQGGIKDYDQICNLPHSGTGQNFYIPIQQSIFFVPNPKNFHETMASGLNSGIQLFT